jgi:2-polyprenyl-3-methyl-5-hydroxy-6-metoxy-1,4-benzoquinol methylase
MKRRGWKIEGLDVSAGLCRRVSRELNAVVHCGELPHPHLPLGKFDLVTFWQVLEHLHDPVATLREARKLLTTEGSVVASTPNFASWSRKTFQHAWLGLDLPRHLVHYTPETMRKVFEAAGFRVLRIQHVAMDGWIRRSAATIRSADRKTWASRLTWKPAAAVVAAWSEWSQTADNILIEAVPA